MHLLKFCTEELPLRYDPSKAVEYGVGASSISFDGTQSKEREEQGKNAVQDQALLKPGSDPEEEEEESEESRAQREADFKQNELLTRQDVVALHSATKGRKALFSGMFKFAC